LLGHSWSVFKNEFVTNTMHGLEVKGTAGIRLEFLAQPQNVVINRACAGIIFKAPDLIQKFVPGDRPPRTRDKEPEELELQSGENNWYVRASDFRPE
jgi:hypothetical protein